VADAFDAMTSNRSYRPARSLEEGVAELRRCAGTDFDPEIVAAFLRALEVQKWEPPQPVVLPSDIPVQTTLQDHDDPSRPLKVAGENNAW
jgi:HD-GYP domain-containing protein (c-di-GMP phosphodiesterase class II)